MLTIKPLITYLCVLIILYVLLQVLDVQLHPGPLLDVLLVLLLQLLPLRGEGCQWGGILPQLALHRLRQRHTHTWYWQQHWLLHPLLPNTMHFVHCVYQNTSHTALWTSTQANLNLRLSWRHFLVHVLRLVLALFASFFHLRTAETQATRKTGTEWETNQALSLHTHWFKVRKRYRGSKNHQYMYQCACVFACRNKHIYTHTVYVQILEEHNFLGFSNLQKLSSRNFRIPLTQNSWSVKFVSAKCLETAIHENCAARKFGHAR